MKKPVVESDKGGDRFDLVQYQYSKEVVRDFPKILHIYEKLLPVLKEYQKYTGVYEVHQSVEDCRALMQIQLNFYQKIYKSKGKLKDE